MALTTSAWAGIAISIAVSNPVCLVLCLAIGACLSALR